MSEIMFKPKPNKKYKPLYSYLFPAKSSSPLKNESPIVEEYEEEQSIKPENQFKTIIPDSDSYNIFKENIHINLFEDLKLNFVYILYTYSNNNFNKFMANNLKEFADLNFKSYDHIALVNKNTDALEYYKTNKDFIKAYWIYIGGL